MERGEQLEGGIKRKRRKERKGSLKIYQTTKEGNKGRIKEQKRKRMKNKYKIGRKGEN